MFPYYSAPQNLKPQGRSSFAANGGYTHAANHFVGGSSSSSNDMPRNFVFSNTQLQQQTFGFNNEYYDQQLFGSVATSLNSGANSTAMNEFAFSFQHPSPMVAHGIGGIQQPFLSQYAAPQQPESQTVAWPLAWCQTGANQPQVSSNTA
ncbi:hypothetical protein BCR33DRAFT_716621 [Rhizoclosmatium globosum]|uniref:Uncharacterized protein n=1 Tax=Rhizoclosmatium globosum TaxID=329046 RepID=A0A1Y2CEL6_9FUNG|nr:hypothetical protein BCR33DRAFT_716621 [Rhizoclosmatium globosum]|eukprot:ORY45337.1 hypothetical protein BCR33DRAFT_716621 [Rhizoclosmatium globosum]